jgi:MFS superfamily sulfate permease-like transporter
VIGFTTGIAIIIALSQVRDLLGLAIEKMPSNFFSQVAVLGERCTPSTGWRSRSACAACW